MSRWEPDAKQRLERAAFELFLDVGYSATTVPQIAARAGVTNRTFFRYFGDKQEVLFAADDAFPERVHQIARSAPVDVGLWDLLRFGMAEAVGRFFDENADYFRKRRRIISSEQSLVERELGKQALLTAAIREGFIALGHPPVQAAVAAEIGVAALRLAQDSWSAHETGDTLSDHLRAAFDAIETTTDPAGQSGAHPESTVLNAQRMGTQDG